MSESKGFDRLHKGVQRWIWGQNWSALRDIQENSIEPILQGDQDIIISASTAAGKTEAAFLPALSRIAEREEDSVGILYISPLKALINDQCRRLQGLSEVLGVTVTPWHGDVNQAIKNKLRKNPSGVLLITPESLESLLINQPGWTLTAFSSLQYIIIDEFHAFIGTERGSQLQSLLHRLEYMQNRIIPRIALSATLGDMQSVAKYLRHNDNFSYQIIESSTAHSDLKLQMRGYIEKTDSTGDTPTVLEEIVSDLFRILRGNSNLVFANSRGRTEYIAAKLSDTCEKLNVPNEFFPHHGNLSKELRESLEQRLQSDKLPTTAVCTMTLELGIDIGNVDSIAQITPPHSVSSLRQRLGRSGRRGSASILRLFIPEDEITPSSHFVDRLRIQTIQCIAMINLLLEKWYEPPPENQYHLSTLVQQTLSIISQFGGVRAEQLWSLLCGTGPYKKVDQSLYSQILRSLGQHDLITQLQDGQITLGEKGERVVGHYSFYTAFLAPEEYRLECNGKALGTLPIDKPLIKGEHVIFAGKRWQVLYIDPEKKLISLEHAKGGKPPKFGGEGLTIHNIVRQEMKNIYETKIPPVYLDEQAKLNYIEAIDCFNELNLTHENIIESGNSIYIFTWLGDRVVNTITTLLQIKGLKANSFGGVIEISDCNFYIYNKTVKDLLDNKPPTTTELAYFVPDTITEKNDIYLSKEISDINYGSKYFDIDGAWAWFCSK